MVRTLSLCALLVAWPSFGRAQVRLTIQPMPALTPALKYQLLPDLREMNPGNAVQGFMKCFMEQQNFFFEKEAQANRNKWLAMPLKDLRREKLHQYGVPALTQADYAARLDTVDWQVLLKARSDGYNLLLPEVQQFRLLAAALKVRLRAEVADGRFGDAVKTAQTMLALGRSFNEHPGIIPSFVGVAVAAITLEGLEEMIQQPGCPNLYWALTNLPSPLMDNRKGLQGEEIFAAAAFNGLDPTVPMAAEALEKIRARLVKLMAGRDADKEQQQLKAWLKAREADEEYVREARSRLAGDGATKDRVSVLPALQVVLLDEKREFDLRLDEGRKWMTLPYWQAEAGLRAANPIRHNDHMLAEVFLPNFVRMRMAQARVERPIALLRQVEAIRHYVAGHAGSLPARLEDMSLPVPIDPIHGVPFDYAIEGGTAVLRATSPVGFEAAPSLHYIVTIRK